MDGKLAFGQVLRAAREATGLSQEKFADAVGVDRTTISLLERGKQSPTLDMLFRLARELKASPSQLVAQVEKLTGR